MFALAKRPFVICSLCCLSAAAIAKADQSFFINLIGGLGGSVQNAYSQKLWLTSNIQNRYVGNQSSEFAYMLGIGAGLNKQLGTKTNMALSLNLYRVQFNDASGVVQPLYNFATDFDQLNYTYTIKPAYIGMLQAQFSWPYQLKQFNLNPYIMAGAGMAYERVTNYQETTPAGSTASPMTNPFGNNSSVHAAWSIGFGVSHEFVNHNSVSMGYQYFWADRASLSPSLSQSTQNELQTPVLQGHFLNITYSFAV